jgi:hypothetical protein
MVVDTTHCLVAGAILLGKEELNIVSWTGMKMSPALRGNFFFFFLNDVVVRRL